MAELIAAVDEAAADQLLDTAIGLVPAQNSSGSGALGPFVASYAASATFAPGDVDLRAPDIIRITDFQLNWHLSMSFGIDLSTILPDFCLPQVCVKIPCVGEVCTPRICVDWPTITVPVSFGDFLRATADFGLDIRRDSGDWVVSAIVRGVPNLQFGPTSAALLAAIGLALTPILLAVPFIGPFLALAVDAILLIIGIAGVTGFLGPIPTPFVSGLQIGIYRQPENFQVLPAGGPVDPPVTIHLDDVQARITSDTEDELVLTVDIS